MNGWIDRHAPSCEQGMWWCSAEWWCQSLSACKQDKLRDQGEFISATLAPSPHPTFHHTWWEHEVCIETILFLDPPIYITHKGMGETISTSAGVSMVWFGLTVIPAQFMLLLLPFISVRGLDSHWNRLVKQLFHGKPVKLLTLHVHTHT